MKHDILLQDNSILRFETLGGHCVHISHGRNGAFAGSGMNRYGIINENALVTHAESNPSELQPTITGNVIALVGGSRLAINSPSDLLVERDGKTIAHVTELTSRPNGGFRLVFSLNDSERLYGLGDENREHLQKRGHRAEMVLRNVTSYIPIPFVMSTNGWAFLLNTTFYHIIDVDSIGSGQIVCECARGDLDVYLFIAPTMTELLDY